MPGLKTQDARFQENGSGFKIQYSRFQEKVLETPAWPWIKEHFPEISCSELLNLESHCNALQWDSVTNAFHCGTCFMCIPRGKQNPALKTQQIHTNTIMSLSRVGTRMTCKPPVPCQFQRCTLVVNHLQTSHTQNILTLLMLQIAGTGKSS